MQLAKRSVSMQREYYAYANELHCRLSSALDSIETHKNLISVSNEMLHEGSVTDRAANALRIIKYMQQLPIDQEVGTVCVLDVVDSAYDIAQQLNAS